MDATPTLILIKSTLLRKKRNVTGYLGTNSVLYIAIDSHPNGFKNKTANASVIRLIDQLFVSHESSVLLLYYFPLIVNLASL